MSNLIVRFSVRISSHAQYNTGLFILDLNKAPWGCGTSPPPILTDTAERAIRCLACFLDHWKWRMAIREYFSSGSCVQQALILLIPRPARLTSLRAFTITNTTR